MLNRLDLRGIDPGAFAGHLPRPVVDGDEPVSVVRTIIEDVRRRGDAALTELADRFDGGAPEEFRVKPAEIAAAWDRTPPRLRTALTTAAESIAEFHQTQVSKPHTHHHRGIEVTGRSQPVDRAGCYVPGGRAAYPSTVLMTALPAKAAGVPEIALCVPPSTGGRIADITLAAAQVAEVDEVYAIGGAQAIAAMAYGTESVRAVDVIAGPGNVYVAIAKREVAGDVGVAAAFAGPSEIVVIADETAPVSYAAVDILVQAEHGPGGLAWLVTWDERVADDVDAEIARLAAIAPRRAEIAATLATGGYLVLVRDRDAAITLANLIAPEHLQLMVDDPAALATKVRHAGAVFCGPLSPASIGDYVAGPSHVLPTNGTARFAGALTVRDFCKDIHVITVTQDGLDALGGAAIALADAEGLDAHALSVRLRIDPATA